MTDTRTQLKARFSSGQRIGESDFSALIDSLAHLTEDIANGSLAEGDQLSALSVGLEDLKIYAEAIRSELDGYVGTHPTLEQVTDADAAVRDELNASITSSVQSLQDDDQEILGLVNENNEISGLLLDVFTESFYALDNDITGIYNTHATKALLDAKVQDLQAGIESKADTIHTHEEYATKVSIENFITAEDIPNFADELHQHTVADITDLDGMFATDARVLELIEENRSTIDVNAIIADGYYTKGEVDQKFYVLTLDTSQITGFNTEVSSIASSIAQVELATAKEQISADLNIDGVESDVTQLSTDLTNLTTTVGENSTAITSNDTQVRLDFASADESVRTDFAAADAQIKLDFASADESTLTSAKDYTDTRITDLIGGASDAFDTLKEIETALEAGDVTGDVLTSLNNINQEIDDNDTELDNIRKWLGRTTLELELSPPETALSADASPGDSTIHVADETGFSVGDEIVIGIGTSQEIATISELGSLILESPLSETHPAGTKVALRNPLISSIASISGGSASSSDLEALQQTVATLESSITTLQSNQSTLQTDLDTANGNITTLQSELDTAEQNISTLTTDLGTAQASITSLQDEIIAQQALIDELEEMIEEGAYSQNNYFARYYVTDGYSATFESGYYVVDGYTSVGYTSQYA